MKKFVIAAIVGAAALSATPALALTNLLANGSFENGFDDWTVNNGTGVGQGSENLKVISYLPAADAYGEGIPVPGATGNPSPDAVGTHGAYFVSDHANPQSISQTVTLEAGKSYTFGFDIYKPANGAANPNDATFTATLAGLDFTSFLASAAIPATTTWTHFSGANTYNADVTGDFVFSFFTDGFPAKDFVVDRVYLIETSTIPTVPEPATWAMMLVGFGMVGYGARHRRRAQVLA